jgi:rod shape-determining protein MreD
MLNAGVLAAAALLAVLLQTTVFPAVLPAAFTPNLLLILVAYLALRHQSLAGVTGAFLLGYLLDTFSGTRLGVQAFALTAAYGSVYVIARRLWTETGLSVMGMAFLGACVQAFAAALVLCLVEPPAPVWQHMLSHGFVEAAVAALVAPAGFAFVAWEKRVLRLA